MVGFLSYVPLSGRWKAGHMGKVFLDRREMPEISFMDTLGGLIRIQIHKIADETEPAWLHRLALKVPSEMQNLRAE